MNEKNTDVTFGDIVFSSGKYVKDGKERNRYHKVGVLRVSQETAKLLSGHHITIKLDTVPVGGDGWLRVFKRDDWVDPSIQSTGDQITQEDIPEF